MLKILYRLYTIILFCYILYIYTLAQYMTVTLKVTLVTLPHFLPKSLNWHFYKHIESFFYFIQRFYFYFFGLSQKGKRNFALSKQICVNILILVNCKVSCAVRN